MASSTVNDVSIAQELDAINATLSRTTLDENNNSTTDDVLQAIDDYLNEPPFLNDEFDDITEPNNDGLSTLSSDTSTLSGSYDYIIFEEGLQSEDTRRTRVRFESPSLPPLLVKDSDDDWEPQIIAEFGATASRPLYNRCHIIDVPETPPPSLSVSPIEQEDQINAIDQILPILDTRPAAFCARVFARKFADYRSDSIFYGTFTSPYFVDALQSQMQYDILVDKATHLIQHTRPFNSVSTYVVHATKPEISYYNDSQYCVYIYPSDYARRVNPHISEPASQDGLAYITISLLLHAQLVLPGQQLRRRQPDSDGYSSGSEHPAIKKPRRRINRSTQTSPV